MGKPTGTVPFGSPMPWMVASDSRGTFSICGRGSDTRPSQQYVCVQCRAEGWARKPDLGPWSGLLTRATSGQEVCSLGLFHQVTTQLTLFLVTFGGSINLNPLSLNEISRFTSMRCVWFIIDFSYRYQWASP